MTLGLFPQETADGADALSRMTPAGPVQPGIFAGAAGAAVMGVGEGVAKVVIPSEGSDQLPPAPPMGGLGTPEWVYTKYEKQLQEWQARKTELQELTPEEQDQRTRQATLAAVKAFTPDPITTGVVGQTLHGLTSGLTRFLMGARVGGPVGGALAVGASEGYATSAQAEKDNIDPATRRAMAVASGLMSGAGALLPGGVTGKLVTRVVSGAAIQETAGLAQRGMLHSILAENGYKAQAEQYKMLDGQAMLTDAVLGSAFGILHPAHGTVNPDVVDAALSSADALHVEHSAPGIPVDPVSRTNNVDNLTAHAEAMISGVDMPEVKPVDTIRNPAQDELQARASQAVDDVVQETTGEPVASPEKATETLGAVREPAPAIEIPSGVMGNVDSALAENVKTPTQAVSDLTTALKTLKETEGTDEQAHATARAIVARADEQGWASVAKQAAMRAGEGSDRILADAAANEKPILPTEGLDAATRESVEAAQRLIQSGRDFNLTDDAGAPVKASELLRKSLDDIRNGQSDGELHAIAAACFGRV